MNGKAGIIGVIVSLVFFNHGFPLLEITAIFLFTYYLIDFIDNFGKSLWQILDILVINALATWVIAPLFSYHYFNNENYLAVLWDKTMRVDSQTYYSFVIPAIIALIFGIKAPFLKKRRHNFDIVAARKTGRLDRPNTLGYQLLTLSFIATILSPYTPSSLAFVLFLFNKLSIIGVLYLYFSGRKPKNIFLIFAILLVLIPSIRGGMFGEMIYLFILGSIIVNQGNKLKFLPKLGIVFSSIFLIVLLQTVKSDYRKVAWTSGGDPSYFIDLIGQRLLSPSKIYNEEILFNISVRANQGWLIAATMDNIPKVVPFSNGEPIWLSILGSIVPRFLWPDKPKAGGAANLKRYLGWELNGTSMNVSPLGEAWANFGWTGGIIFIFLYGLFFRVVYGRILSLSNRFPTLIIWFPLIFMYVVVTESDVLSSLNHLIKSGMFIFLMYRIYPKVFKVQL